MGCVDSGPIKMNHKNCCLVNQLTADLLGHIKTVMDYFAWGYWPVQSTQRWWLEVIFTITVFLSKDFFAVLACFPITVALDSYSF